MLSAILAAGAAGLSVGRSNSPLPEWLSALIPAPTKPNAAKAEATGPIIYYRDPGRYGSRTIRSHRRTHSAGKEYLPVRASEDVDFEEKAPEVAAAKAGERGRIRFYRNPMGLPDTSPTPRRTSWGWTISLSMRASRTTTSSVKGGECRQASKGRRSDRGRKAAHPEHGGSRTRHRSGRRAPQSVQVSLRFEGFIDSVENVTTGSHVHEG